VSVFFTFIVILFVYEGRVNVSFKVEHLFVITEDENKEMCQLLTPPF